MTSPPEPEPTWEAIWGSNTPEIPHTPLDDTVRRRHELPRTLLPTPEGLRSTAVFDPALKEFGRAFRAGEPRFADEASARDWHRARRTVLDTVLAAVADGPWADHLMLRGSVLMATWFGDAARDPGDLDFVVVPQGWQLADPRTAGLFDGIARDAEAAARGGGAVRIDAGGRVTEDIWSYERVPGRRMLLPWTAPGTAGGTVQLDLVFNEPLPAPPVPTRLRPLGDGPGCRLPAASPELSLAWKLLWLVSDFHPQGKDLYDAVLLAERTPPSYALVRDTFVRTGVDGLRPAGSWWTDTLRVAEGWEHFTAEYPWVEDDPDGYAARLASALAPLLAEAEPPGETRYERWARWLEPLVESARASSAPPADTLRHLAAGGWEGLLATVVIVRELAGRGTLDAQEALRTVVDHHESWRLWRENPEWWAAVLDELR
ncbi:nucleotidyl transferase AbiEii/AbiGii toxin family protein [Streptomyces sp. NPDC048636]|uniref:nucleotidyl transferase AbiEii/AbiGii toxin family protein n=1 Tax=Streptomyces sp. NPDC048636 TaxID=3155762 RepID=UPI00343CFD64